VNDSSQTLNPNENTLSRTRERTETWDVLGDFTTTTQTLPLSALALGIGVIAAFVALALLRLIGGHPRTV
jgi:hypothetical protein